VTRDDRIAPGILTRCVGDDRNVSRLQDCRQRAAGSDIRSSPASDRARHTGEVTVAGRCHGDVSGVSVGRNVGEPNRSNIVRVAAARRIVRVSGKLCECAKSAGATVCNGTVR